MTVEESDNLERVIALRDAWRELSFAHAGMTAAIVYPPGDGKEALRVDRAAHRVCAACASLRALGADPFEPLEPLYPGELVAGDVAAALLDEGEQLVAGDAAAEVLDHDGLGAADVVARAASAGRGAPAPARSYSAPLEGRHQGELPCKRETR